MHGTIISLHGNQSINCDIHTDHDPLQLIDKSMICMPCTARENNNILSPSQTGLMFTETLYRHNEMPEEASPTVYTVYLASQY